ncbi:MAG TPA: carbohydrate-binding family 9-like protein, partial [Urbifossiella sp.]
KDGGLPITAWEITGLKTAVRVDGTINKSGDKDRGWTVEIRWPFEGLQELGTLKFPPRDGDRWRINFSRVEWDTEVVEGQYRKVKDRPEHNWVWSPQGVIDMHRPERWGYLQFSTEAPGKATFRTDPDWPVRDLLHRVYYAERAYRKANGKYSPTLEKLDLKGLSAPLSGPITLETTANGFEASLTRPGARGEKPRRFSITHNALLTVE